MSRLEKTIGFLIFLLLVMGLGIGLFFWNQANLEQQLVVQTGELAAPAAGSSAQPVFTGQSALIAFGMAQHALAEASPDAVLLRGQAVWPIVAGERELLAGEQSWQFTFYSPAAAAARTVTIVGETVTLEPAIPVDLAGRPMDPGSWRINSGEAVQIFLNNGGREFLSTENNVSVTMNLDMLAQSEQPEWLIAAIGTQTGRSLTLWVDATTGEILNYLAGG